MKEDATFPTPPRSFVKPPHPFETVAPIPLKIPVPKFNACFGRDTGRFTSVFEDSICLAFVLYSSTAIFA
nr:MAG: hypothetical protein [Bacteriophage sp.]